MSSRRALPPPELLLQHLVLPSRGAWTTGNPEHCSHEEWSLLLPEEVPAQGCQEQEWHWGTHYLVSAEERARLSAADLAHGVFQVWVNLNLRKKPGGWHKVGTKPWLWAAPAGPHHTGHQHPSQRHRAGCAGQGVPSSITHHTHTPPAPWAAPKPLPPAPHLFSKLGSFDFHKGSGHRLQVTALVVKGDTARPWKKPDHKHYTKPTPPGRSQGR